MCKAFFIAKFLGTKLVYEELVDQALGYLKECGLQKCTDYLAVEAEFLHTIQNYTMCIQRFQEMRRLDPYRFEDCGTFSNVLFTSSKRVELASLAHELNDAEPFRAEACVVMGNYYSLRGEHQKAIEFFDRAVRLNPYEKSGTWILLGHEYTEINEPQMAIAAYKRAQQVDPNDHRSWYALGQQYELLEMHTASMFYFSKAANLQPYNTVILSALADSMAQCGKKNAAEILLRRCVAISGNLDASSIEGQTSLYRLAKFYENNRKEPSAAHYYSLYVRKLESCGGADNELVMDVYIYLANYFKKEAKYELAEEYAKDALKSSSTKDEAKRILADLSAMKS